MQIHLSADCTQIAKVGLNVDGLLHAVLVPVRSSVDQLSLQFGALDGRSLHELLLLVQDCLGGRIEVLDGRLVLHQELDRIGGVDVEAADSWRALPRILFDDHQIV